MVAQQHADECGQRTPKAWKRRGILAAAWAVVAAMMATQTNQSVGAAGTPITTGDTVTAITTTTLDATTSTTPTAMPAFVVKNNFTGSVDPMGFGVGGFASGGAAGVFGRNNDLNGVGLWGEAPNGTGVFGDSSSGSGVTGSTYAQAIGAILGFSQVPIGIGVHGQADEFSSIGVSGTAALGIGGSFQGGHAPLKLVPGALSAANLVASGHQAGELYVTSDTRLFFFTGTAWHEVSLGPPTAVPQAQPAAPVQQSAPAPLPTRQATTTTLPGAPNPLPPSRP